MLCAVIQFQECGEQYVCGGGGEGGTGDGGQGHQQAVLLTLCSLALSQLATPKFGSHSGQQAEHYSYIQSFTGTRTPTPAQALDPGQGGSPGDQMK